jgi:CheY-like chemotaxis protein
MLLFSARLAYSRRPVGAPADILLVEDDDDLSEVLAELLAEYGYVVATARNGEDGLQWLRAAEQMPRLILLDLTMPVMSGDEFCRDRDRDPALAAIPVFLLTARGEPAAHQATLRVQRAFRKPLDMDALLDAISDVLER